MRSAFVLCLLSLVLSATAAPKFVVTPYVQHPATNAMTVIFFTDEPCEATVTCGPQTQTVTCVEAAAVKNGSSLRYRGRVRFEGLEMQTDYRYAVALANGGTYRNAFRTLPGKDTPVRFIGYCDSETKNGTGVTDEWNYTKDGKDHRGSYYVSRSVGFASNIVHMVSRRPDLITVSGDLVAEGHSQTYWDEYWKENAGGLGLGYNDPAGSIPILAAIGNHDLKDGSTLDRTKGGAAQYERFFTYFEFNANGVRYDVSDGTDEPEARDMSQLFHRTDLGPVTLVFLDTNKGAAGYGPESTQDYADRPAMRSPDFHPGSLQYNWLTNQLADAQRNSRFTFVINHHCPYSVGQHNRPSNGNGYAGYNTGSGYDGESARAVRCLTETMIRYGVDAWLCGHDEIQEHSQTNGFEVLPDGTKRAHTLNVYDLGSGGDGLRGQTVVENPREVFRAFKDEPCVWDGDTLVAGGNHYGFLEVDVTTNRNGRWTCSLTPCYDFINKVNGKAATFELRRYRDRIIIDEESDRMVYQERLGDAFPADYVEYVREAADLGDDPPPDDPLPDDPPPDEPPPDDPVAGAFVYRGCAVTASGAERVEIEGSDDLVLRFTQSGALVVTNGFTADILVVGGGGGGGGGQHSSTPKSYWGDPGHGGSVEERMSVTLDAPDGRTTFAIAVGEGGTPGVGGTSKIAGHDGGTGGTSSFSGGGLTLGASGGAGGKSRKNSEESGESKSDRKSEAIPGSGRTSAITGDTYGVPGRAVTESGAPVSPAGAAANTGNGGDAASDPAAEGVSAGASGGSGVVIVRITAVVRGETPDDPGDPVDPVLTPFERLCAAAAENAGTFALEDDLEFPQDGVLTIAAGTDFTLDLRGHAIDCHADGAIVNRGRLTIVDSAKAGPLRAHLAYTAAELGKGLTLVRNEGELTVDGVFVDAGCVNGADSEFGGGNTAIAATGGSVTVRGGAHVGGRTAIDAGGDAKVGILGAHAAGYRWGCRGGRDSTDRAVAAAATVRDHATLLVSNATMEAEGRIVSASETAPPQEQAFSRGGGVSPARTVTIVDSVLATTRTVAPFDLGSGVGVSLVRSTYVDRMAGWFPITTALANEGANLKVGAGCLLAVASESVVGFLDGGVTAGRVAPRVWRTKGATGEALPPLTDEERSRIAEILSSSPDTLLKAKVTTVREYMDYRSWVDAGVAAGVIDSQDAAKGAAGSFFSFATDQAGIVDPSLITEDRVKIEEVKANDGGLELTVGIEDLPVGKNAQAEYLSQVFGVTGAQSPEAAFETDNVTYGDMRNNGDGTVSCSAEPAEKFGEPAQFFFKAQVAK